MEQIVAHLDDPCVRAFPEVMLTCTSAPGYVPVDQELGEASLYFWFNMEETFNELNLPKTPYVADLFKRVLDQMVVSVRRPSASVWQSWSLEVRDRFKAYRSDCFDTVQYCSIIVAHETFGHILPKAWAAMAVNDYDGLESTLYVLTSLADYWMAEWSGLLYQVLTKIVTVVSDVQHSRLVRTTLGLLEAFAGPIIAMGRNSIELSIRFTLSVISNGLCRSNVPIGLRCLNELLRGALSPDFAYSISAAVLNLGHCIAVSRVLDG